MDNGSKPEVPSIVTEGLSSIPVIRIDDHEESSASTLPTTDINHPEKPSDPSLLSPGILRPGRRSFDTTASDDGAGGIPPPSPTLSSQSSVHFRTSLALRDNKPGDGATSLALLNPLHHTRSHSRRPSNATTTSTDEGTGPDHPPGLPYPHPTTNAGPIADPPSSPTPTHVGSVGDNGKRIDKRKRFWRKVKGNTEETPEEGDGDDVPLELQHAEDLHIDPTPFAFKPYQLASLVDPKNLEALDTMGGTWGLLAGLGVDPSNGLSVGRKTSEAEEAPVVVIANLADARSDAVEKIPFEPGAYSGSTEDRRRVYGTNVLPARKSKPLLELMWLALKDKVLILLSIAAVISLALGFFQDFGQGRDPAESPVDWVEGVAIIAAIFIVVMVGSVNDWQKERQFRILNDKKEERGVKVVRSGVECVIDVKDLLVGDIALLEPGEIVPCDGVFISGHNVRCDESGATGESDAIKKIAYDECISLREQTRHEDPDAHGFDSAHAHTDCFLVSGTKVLEGYGKYVVIAVGQESFNGRIMMALRAEPDPTPLQEKLNNLAELIAKIGGIAGLILFASLMIRFFVQLGTGDPVRTALEKGIAFTQILIVSVTLVVVAVPEGLPLAVTLALAFATKRMTAENLLVRILGSCETMANASVVCTDKTGMLTQNVMSVVAGSIGIHAKFVRNLEENTARTIMFDQEDQPQEQDDTEVASEPQVDRRHPDDFSIDQSDINTILSPQLRRLLNQSITINSTASEEIDPETRELIFVGSKTEIALLQFAKDLGWENWKETRESARVVEIIPFSSERKAMGVVVRLQSGRYRLFLKGASEILAKKCTRHVVVSRDPDNDRRSDSEIETEEIDEIARDNISRTIISYTNQTLRTLALCYRDFESWPPAGAEAFHEHLFRDLTLVAITAIEDPLRPGVREAVATCHKAGVTIKMCTGDNILTARSIATQCGIYTPGGIIMEGPVFRALEPYERVEVVPRLQVLARSSPEDKKILVETLRSLGEIVGVTGGGANDGPALKTANVGFSMGIAGTEAAREASDIILMDDNFASIAKAIMWGRCVNDAVRKFLQFQITTNITAVIITFVSAVASTEEASALSAVQLLWINIIMDTFAALALATDPASISLLDRKPDTRGTRLFTADMIKMILGQSMYQVVIILVFHFLGHSILGIDHSEHGDKVVNTLVFNTFVFAQIFNSINCRRLDRKLNIFEGIFRNRYFIAITLIEIGGQVLIVFTGGAAFQVTPIPGREWGISLALGFVSIPLGILIRNVPTPPLERAFIKLRLISRDEILPTTKPKTAEWNEAITRVRDNLSMFASLRGGRVNASSFILKSRQTRSPKADRLALPSLMTMIPTPIASSIGAGWTPSRAGLSDPAQNDPSRSSIALWEGKIQLHPDTRPDDPAFRRWSPGDYQMSSIEPLVTPLVIREELQCCNHTFESLVHTLSSKNWQKTLYTLPSERATRMIDDLERGLHEDSGLCPYHRKRFFVVLRKMCCKHKLLPSSYAITSALEWTEDIPLKSGGSADVWRGRYQGSMVAIKVLRVDKENLASLERSFYREVVSWKQFKHPNLLLLEAATKTSRGLTMISKWMESGTIMDFIVAHPGTNRPKLLTDVARGLKYLHDWPSVHADLKSGNILIDRDSSARIADFGLTSVLRNHSMKVSVTPPSSGGTVLWMAPELFSEDSRPTKASDIYAFGMVTYEVFAQQEPFPRDSYYLVPSQVSDGKRPSRPSGREVIGLSDEVWMLAERCWDGNPTARPDVAEILPFFEAASNDWVPPTPDAIVKLGLDRSTSTRGLPSRKSSSILSDAMRGSDGTGSGTQSVDMSPPNEA